MIGVRWCAMLLAAASLGGCASATRGWQEQLTLTSTPSGATAEVISTTTGGGGAPPPDERTGEAAPPEPGPGKIVCITPCVVQVKRNDDISVRFTLSGYHPELIPLTKEVASNGAVGFAGNLLLGGVVGMAVDAASGATLDHKPNPVIATMRPVDPPPRAQPPRRGHRPTARPSVGY